MSESETRDVTMRAFTAFNAGDMEGTIACLSEDVAVDVPGQAREIGREKARWRLAALARHFRAEAADIAVMTAPGGFRAAAEFTLSGTYLAALPGFPPASGQSFRLPAGLFLDIDDEALISRVTVCCDPTRLSRALEKG
ncbi:nuclear transport factor 2 family protein [Chelativorans sp. AA-79]|uniref:nuclear transport factor 2 family protein n=1 Tax=Chelativorans sp. AA-79 TaxID=3028735 RepID=UPI0023F82A4D|nr:nuclear transport factor 2 family protein [Chelativorans sp. AA-79]WEX11282.1 nuclear transport factor 2 family protein [Chelativorans sp. AA-79]